MAFRKTSMLSLPLRTVLWLGPPLGAHPDCSDRTWTFCEIIPHPDNCPCTESLNRADNQRGSSGAVSAHATCTLTNVYDRFEDHKYRGFSDGPGHLRTAPPQVVLPRWDGLLMGLQY
jgi:hypothetical protein